MRFLFPHLSYMPSPS